MLSNEQRAWAWQKPVALLIVLGVVVGAVTVFPRSQHMGMKMALSQKGDTASLAAVDQETYLKHTHNPEAGEDRATGDEVENDIAGQGSGLQWVDGIHPNNCPQVCGGMIAVASGADPRVNSKYFVCAARGNAPYHGLRPGYNLPAGNSGRCAFAWGHYLNKGVFKCLCRTAAVHPLWVGNKNLIASCHHVCELAGKEAVRGGVFQNRNDYPRYDICSVCHPSFGCRGGWNLDLVGWASYCTTPWGLSHGKFQNFKCLCV